MHQCSSVERFKCKCISTDRCAANCKNQGSPATARLENPGEGILSVLSPGRLNVALTTQLLLTRSVYMAQQALNFKHILSL